MEERTRFAVICDLHRLSHSIRSSLKLAERLADSAEQRKEIYRSIKREMKLVPVLLNGIREYIAEHSDKELAQQFGGLYGDAKRLYGLCSAHTSELRKETFYAGNAFTSMEIIGQYFFPKEKGSMKAANTARPMTRAEATDCIDTIRAVIRKSVAIAGTNKGNEAGKEVHAMLSHISNEQIETVKEYITNANDKDLARLFTEDFAKAVHLSMVFQNGSPQTQLAGIKMFHLALTMGYIKRNILHEDANASEVRAILAPIADFTAADTVQGGAFSTTAQVPVLRLYRFLTAYTVQSGPDKGKSILDGNAVSDKDFIHAVMRADYSTAYRCCVKGKMRCVITLLSKAYFKDWKAYRTTAALSMGLTPENLAKYNVEKQFISKLKELLPMIKQ